MKNTTLVQVFNDADQKEGDPMELTEEQIADLAAQLPTGWYMDGC